MEKLLKIPYNVFYDWDLLQQFLERRGNPKYELVGDVDLSYKKDIFDLGNLVRVDGKLDLFKTSIQSLGNLEYVGGYLDLVGTPIQSLGNLEYVGGYLDLRNTPIESLGNLQYVGEEFWLSRNHQIPEEQLTKFKFNNY
mgnify:FL=1